MNKVFLIGRLTQDPTTTTLQSGHVYCRFSIAVNRNFASRDAENKADFINIVTWDKLAENCAKYLLKGSQVAIVGSIQTSTYEKDGVKRQTFEVRADQVEFLSRAGSNGATTQAPVQSVDSLKEVDTGDDELPF